MGHRNHRAVTGRHRFCPVHVLRLDTNSFYRVRINISISPAAGGCKGSSYLQLGNGRAGGMEREDGEKMRDRQERDGSSAGLREGQEGNKDDDGRDWREKR